MADVWVSAHRRATVTVLTKMHRVQLSPLPSELQNANRSSEALVNFNRVIAFHSTLQQNVSPSLHFC